MSTKNELIERLRHIQECIRLFKRRIDTGADNDRRVKILMEIKSLEKELNEIYYTLYDTAT
jgi:septal ring factor EnvC (AmiA/AmiB activator)